jgi:hypothetical protein
MQSKNILASFLFLIIGLVSMAQGPSGMPTPPPPGPPPPPGLPIDDGIIPLFVIALIYGVYKLNKIRKELV